MMILWDDAFEPPARPAEPTRQNGGDVAPSPPLPDPDEDEKERQPPGRSWEVAPFEVTEELSGHPFLLALPAISLAWLFLVALYLR